MEGIGVLQTLGFNWLIEDTEGKLYDSDMIKLQEYNNGNQTQPFKAKIEKLGEEGKPYHQETNEILSVYDIDGNQL